LRIPIERGKAIGERERGTKGNKFGRYQEGKTEIRDDEVNCGEATSVNGDGKEGDRKWEGKIKVDGKGIGEGKRMGKGRRRVRKGER